ncbi:cell division protein FtsQ [candidate division KSB1 bacterium]|nr:cell division protein FtsQ [candidate division KSB1 bacterium]
MNRPGWSQWILIFSSAVLLGLIIGLSWLQARSEVEEITPIDQIAADAVKDYDLHEAFNADIIEKLRRAEVERSLLPLSAGLLNTLQRGSEGKGEVFAFIAAGNLFPVNEKGEILSADATVAELGAPVLTGSGIKLNPKTKCIDGSLFSETVCFIRSLTKENGLLRHQLSEVHCDPSLGLVVYLSHTGTLPIILGRGKMEEKGRKLNILFNRMGSSVLLSSARYLDARLNGQLVVKKKS